MPVGAGERETGKSGQSRRATLATSAFWARPLETALATSMGVVTHATQLGMTFPSGKLTEMGSWDAPRISSARLACKGATATKKTTQKKTKTKQTKDVREITRTRHVRLAQTPTASVHAGGVAIQKR